MNRHRKKTSVWEHYITREIGIEFKACLYFFSILFFYAMYQLLNGSIQASIIHMAEMVLLAYAMGYIQVYLLSNFDEGEQLRGRECCYMILCSGIYAGASFWGSWFDREIWVSIIFCFYMILLYSCAFFVYKSKRKIDEKILNENLKLFQERGMKHGQSDRDSKPD